MPLTSGTSRKTISKNIETEMHAYERSGKIGTSKPASKKKAQKQAVAIAYRKARESGAKLPKKPTKKKPGPTKSSASKTTHTKSTRRSPAKKPGARRSAG